MLMQKETRAQKEGVPVPMHTVTRVMLIESFFVLLSLLTLPLHHWAWEGEYFLSPVGAGNYRQSRDS